MYSSYTAASFARIHDLADRTGVNLEGALTWAFEFEDQPWFAGFRALTTNGVDLPVMNVFRMFSLMGSERLPVVSSGAVSLDAMLKDGVRGAADVSALASIEGNEVCVLVWHYHDDDVPGPDALVTIDVGGLPVERGTALLHRYRVDREHGNAFEAWMRMGSPREPTAEQVLELERESQLGLVESPRKARVEGGD
jgi:xylan 1,4-beta-xylosidase